MIDQRKKSRWELYRQNWANWHALHPSPIKNSRRTGGASTAPRVKLQDKLKLGLWAGMIIGCMYWMVPHPAPEPDPELVHRHLVAMPNYWMLMSAPTDPWTDERDFNAPLYRWEFGSGPGFRTQAECENSLESMLADGNAGLIPAVQKKLHEFVESYRCIAKDDLLRQEGP